MATKSCLFYNTPKGCSKGSSCTFIHAAAGAGPVAVGAPPVPVAAHAGGKGSKPIPHVCHFFATSGCKFGASCKKPHDSTLVYPYLKRVTCARALKHGSCDTAGCTFQHAPEVITRLQSLRAAHKAGKAGKVGKGGKALDMSALALALPAGGTLSLPAGRSGHMVAEYEEVIIMRRVKTVSMHGGSVAKKAAAVKPPTLNVVFSFDTTGSMSCYLEEVRRVVKELMTHLVAEVPNIRLGVIAHGDYCDRGTTYTLRRTYKLTKDADKLKEFMDGCSATFGGDGDECYELALCKAREMPWDRDATAKVLVMIGDARPHEPGYTCPPNQTEPLTIDWRKEAAALADMGVKVYGVQCGNNSSAQSFYEDISRMTGGSRLPLSSLDSIRDVFTGVCLAHAKDGAAKLAVYSRRVEAEGRMDAGRRQLFALLHESVTVTRTVRTAVGHGGVGKGVGGGSRASGK